MLLTVVSFILVMSVLVFVHELGHFLVAKRNGIIVDEFGLGFPPRIIKVGEWGGTVYSLNAIPFGGFVRLRGEDDPSDPRSFAAAPKLARTLTLLAGPFMNFVLAVLLFALLTGLTGVPDTEQTGALVIGVAPGSPAEQAGLQKGDRVLSIDDEPIANPQELMAATAARLGKSTSLRVARNGQTSSVVMVPRENPPAKEGALGINIGYAMKAASVPLALKQGVETTAQIVYLTFAFPISLVREGRPLGDAGFMGPVGIAVTTGEVVRSSLTLSSIQPLVWFMGLLSTALGVTNLLPIPGLDGGRLLFVIIEAVRRRRIEPSQEGIVHLIGFGLLLILVGVLTVREVSALLTGTFPSVLGVN